jgi:hypothetical protein
MPWVGFESTTIVFERAKTFHASDREATVTGWLNLVLIIYKKNALYKEICLPVHTVHFQNLLNEYKLDW